MKKSKVVKIDSDSIKFENDIQLYSDHEQDCCESHYLLMENLTLEDFEGLQFDLTNDNFFHRIKDYGIELIPIKGHSIKIPGYGYNNGYYSSHLNLVLEGKGYKKTFDISECQDINN